MGSNSQNNFHGRKQPMNSKEYTNYQKSGEIAQQVVKLLQKETTPGASLFELAEKGESKIRELGGKPAFPINISINEIGAHYSPIPNDKKTLGDDIVKIDIGVHVDGYIADTAFTLDFTGDYADMVKANEKALDEALKLATPGTNVSEIGEIIHKTIFEAGYQPIVNLSGHSLAQYNLHAGQNIPNIKTGNFVLTEGMAIAIEPFATDGEGKVTDSPESVIFRYLEDKPVRLREAKTLLKTAKERFDGLPFSMRWVKIPPLKLGLALNQLIQANAIYSYPILKEKRKGNISQFEHTVIVKDKPEVTTRI